MIDREKGYHSDRDQAATKKRSRLLGFVGTMLVLAVALQFVTKPPRPEHRGLLVFDLGLIFIGCGLVGARRVQKLCPTQNRPATAVAMARIDSSLSDCGWPKVVKRPHRWQEGRGQEGFAAHQHRASKICAAATASDQRGSTGCSCGFAFVVPQQSAEPFVHNDIPRSKTADRFGWLAQDRRQIPEAQMRALTVIVGKELGQEMP